MAVVNVKGTGSAGVIKDLSGGRLERVVLLFCFAIGVVCIFGCFEHSDMYVLAINLYRSSPFLSQLMPIDTKKSAGVVCLFAPVLLVLGICAFSKIAPSVIRRVAVYVVNTKFWELAVYIEKRKSVSGNFCPKNSNLDSSGIQKFSIDLPNKRFLSVCFPSKKPRIFVVVECFSKKFYVNFFHFQSPLVDARMKVHGNRYGNRLSGATLAMQGAF